MDPIRPISRREAALRELEPVRRVVLLTPAEREEARRVREALRRRRAAQDRNARADQR
jgi:hypothetical protein